MANHSPKTRINSARARVLFKIKAARGLHKMLRAQGRVPGAEGHAAFMRNFEARKAAKKLLEEKGRSGNTLQDGSY